MFLTPSRLNHNDYSGMLQLSRGALRSFLVLTLSGFILSATQAQAAKISSIEVQGARRVERETILSYLHLTPGAEYDPVIADAGIKDLYATNLFSNIAITQDGSRVVVLVEENPVINRVAFEGNKKNKDDALSAEILSKPRTTYTVARVQSDAQRLRTLYRRSGRYAAKVEPKIIKLPENRVDLIFEINEGPRTTIRKIFVVGNKAFKESDIKTVLSTKESRWWRFFTLADSYDPDRMAYDRELLRKFYQEHGYLDFKVLSSVAELSQDQISFYLTYALDEGSKYRVNTIDIKCDLPNIDALKLKKSITLRERDWFNSKRIEESTDNLTQALGDMGYAFVNIMPKLDKNLDERTVNVTFHIKEGPKVYIGRIDIEGNDVTEDKVIRRQFKILEGDAFDESKLRRTELAIKDLNYFSKAEVLREKGDKPDRMNLRAIVKEKATGELALAGGVGTLDGLLGTLRYTEYNLMGKGQILSVAFTLSKRTQDIDLSFTKPHFLDRNLAAGFDIFKTRTDQKNQSGFIHARTGFGLRAGYLLTEYVVQRWWYTLRRDDISGVKDGASNIIKEQEGRRITSLIGHELARETLDSRLNPTRGYVIGIANEWAGAGGQTKFLRHTAKAQIFFPLAEDVTLTLRATAGTVSGIGQYNLRIIDRFMLGGSALRGFAYAGVGPREKTANDPNLKSVAGNNALGGRYFYTSSAEVLFPVGLPNELGVKGALFADAGSLWSSGLSDSQAYDSRSIRASVGFGIAWDAPLGKLRIDFVKPLKYEKFDNRETIQFSLSSPTL